MSHACLGHDFGDSGLLEQALTHRSAGNRNNERLEFLGDGALNFAIAAELYRRFPDAAEGDLSRQRARLVRKETLASVAAEQGLGDVLILGSGELKSGGHRRSSILADALEAVLGAIYLDAGFATCEGIVLKLFEQQLQQLPPADDLKDPKTRLQEFLQGRQLPVPDYQTVDTQGADHARIFTVRVTVPALKCHAEAQGSSRRKAEQAAAKLMLQDLLKEDGKR
jgi:ribonuclease-3